MRYLLLITIGVFFCNINLWAQDTDAITEARAANAQCLSCHVNRTYELLDTLMGETVTGKMCTNYIIDSLAYYQANHKTFKCLDCHTAEFESVPHPPSVKFEMRSTCIECHGDDEAFAQYDIEHIEADYSQSIHAQRASNYFSCWSCHDAHTYKINARVKDQEVNKTVAYDNGICLSCHANYSKFGVYSDKHNADIMKTHEWLPNQANHFSSVRCIECHTAINDSMLVAHTILPKEKAVKKCVECHSKDSRLMASLYKHNVTKQREKGFINGVIVNDSYVIGANRNIYLNTISLIILGLTIFGIAIHAIFRKLSKH